jgi:hypothetical protein
LHLRLIYAAPYRPGIPGLGLVERGSSSEDFCSVRGWNGRRTLHHCNAFPSQMSWFCWKLDDGDRSAGVMVAV